MYDQKLGHVISTQLVMKMPQSKSVSENMEMITQHIWGHPASFDTEAKDGPEHKDGDVVWRYSHCDPCYCIQNVGHQETDLPAKPAEWNGKYIRWGFVEWILFWK